METRRPPGAGKVKAAPRPPMVAAASVTMIFIGILVIALGLLFVVAAAAPAALRCGNSDPDCLGPYMYIGWPMVAAGLVEIVVAAQVRSGMAWARLVGIALGLAAGLLGLLVLTTNDSGVVPLVVLLLVPNVFVVFALVTNRHWFRSGS